MQCGTKLYASHACGAKHLHLPALVTLAKNLPVGIHKNRTVRRVIHCSSGTARHAVGPSAFDLRMATAVILDLNEE